MDFKDISSLDNKEKHNYFKDFNLKNSKIFHFDFISYEDKSCLYKELEEIILKEPSDSDLVFEALSTIKILSRDKNYLDTLLTANLIEGIFVITNDKFYKNATEALRCLCNCIYNSVKAQKCASDLKFVGKNFLERLKNYKAHPAEFKNYDILLQFLITAFCIETRSQLLPAIPYFTDILKTHLDLISDSTQTEMALITEILKLLFNVTLALPSQPDTLEKLDDESGLCLELTKVIGRLLVKVSVANVLVGHAVNLLTNLPPSSLRFLIFADKNGNNWTGIMIPDAENAERKKESVELNAADYAAISKLVAFLKLKLETKPNDAEELSPILKCLSMACRYQRPIRKFCRQKILPRLGREVLRLPEEGGDLRNRLCKLLTSPSVPLTNLAADLLYVLCKESVSRFVKYTGYGNAAGLLAQRGLMAGHGPITTQYSSSSDSDTEEYKKLKDGVNPVTGRWEEEKKDAMADMTEEQKEYEANKLINQIHNLCEKGLIKPMKINEDGKPIAVEHVTQLLDSNLPSR